MKSNKFSLSIVTGVVFAIAGSSAFASDKWLGDRGDNWQDHVVSTKTRAQVIAELKEARAQGLIVNGDDPHYPRLPVATSTRSRAEVRAEAAGASQNKDRSMEYSSGQ